MIATTTTEKCPNCGIPVGPMPEDAANDEMLCNSCYEIFEQEQATCNDIDTVLAEHCGECGEPLPEDQYCQRCAMVEHGLVRFVNNVLADRGSSVRVRDLGS